jgi:Flp pilus assembly pilin Flp
MKYIDLIKNKKFFAEEEGFTTVEYAIASSLVGVVGIVAFEDIGDVVSLVGTAVIATVGSLGDAVNTVINWLMH